MVGQTNTGCQVLAGLNDYISIGAVSSSLTGMWSKVLQWIFVGSGSNCSLSADALMGCGSPGVSLLLVEGLTRVLRLLVGVFFLFSLLLCEFVGAYLSFFFSAETW